MHWVLPSQMPHTANIRIRVVLFVLHGTQATREPKPWRCHIAPCNWNTGSIRGLSQQKSLHLWWPETMFETVSPTGIFQCSISSVSKKSFKPPILESSYVQGYKRKTGQVSPAFSYSKLSFLGPTTPTQLCTRNCLMQWKHW